MSTEGGVTTSLWAATSETPGRPRLEGAASADVCIVGAGIAGLTTAYLLASEGREVIVLDDGPVGGGETGRTTAHLASEIDDTYLEIERMHGERGARLAYESHNAAIDRIERFVSDERVDCDFRRVEGYLFLSPDETTDFLAKELDAARRAGFTDASPVDGLDAGSIRLGPALRFPRQGQLHPLRYLSALVRAVTSRGGRIVTGARVSGIDAAGGSVRVSVAGGVEIRAGAAVVATNTPINDRFAIHTKQAAYRTYALAASIPEGTVPEALFWDTADPYHYVRLQRGPLGQTMLIVGGEDHKTGQADDTTERHRRLESWARALFPAMGAVEYRWSGQVMETIDGLGFIGRNPLDEPNVYVATGDSGMGMTHGTIAGMLIADSIAGRENEWTALYDPSRKTLRAARTWISENLDVATQLTTHVTPGEVSSIAEIPRGSGALIRRGVTKIAAYRDDDGTVRELSAVCPHLGCVVAWNRLEKTWDCPCHGSRFEARGRVVNGPALNDLRALASSPSGETFATGSR